MIAAFVTQQPTSAEFGVNDDIYCVAPAYDFTRPIAAAPYDIYPWAVTGDQFAALARAAQGELGLDRLNLRDERSDVPGLAIHSGYAGRTCLSASPVTIAAAMATLSERIPPCIGMTTRASAASCTVCGTPALSRPNSSTSASA